MELITDWRVYNEPSNVEEVFELPKEKGNAGKPKLEICGLPTRQEEEEAFINVPVNREFCYGCRRFGEDAAGATSSREVIALHKLIRGFQAKTHPVQMARVIAKKYREIQDDVNSNLLDGEEPWEDWLEPDILAHLRFHHNDPEIHKNQRMTDVHELQEIALKASVVKDPATGAMSLDEKQVKIYIELIKAEELLYKSDPTKQLYYSGGKFIDPQTTTEGPISYSGKNLYSYLTRKRRN
jgi:hypothetical protein